MKLELPHEIIARKVGDKTLNSIMMIIAIIGLSLIITSLLSFRQILFNCYDELFILYLICFVSKQQKEINRLSKLNKEEE